MPNLYRTAYTFLCAQIPDKDPKSVLSVYLDVVDGPPTNPTSNEVFKRILSSAQNANMKAGVIGGAIDGIDNLGKVLFGFNPRKVLACFDGRPEALLLTIERTLKPRGKVRTGKHSLWPQYCKTILSTANFVRSFSSGRAFAGWASHLYEDAHSMAALPLILANEIDGLGYALACDFLKEFGFRKYGKPDVHVREILVGLGLCSDKATPYQMQKILTVLAADAGVTPYAVDKVLWLIGSGKLHAHKHLGKGGQIGRMKDEFIRLRTG